MRATDFIKLNRVDTSKAKKWIDDVYSMYPGTWENNHVMIWGEGDNKQFAMFELIPDMNKPDTVHIKWFQAYPMRTGVGSRAMAELQKLARENGITLTLHPWSKGKISKAALTKFYKKQGFNSVKGSNDMAWSPELTEAPLQSYTTMGDFTKPGPFTGPDKKLVPHPMNQLKTQKFLEQTEYDFRLFFSNISGTGKYRELGPVNHRKIIEIFGDQGNQIIEDSEDAITVVFVGNQGDAKVPLTPWMMAHRFGHAIQAGARQNQGWHIWTDTEGQFFTIINRLLEDYYSVSVDRYRDRYQMKSDMQIHRMEQYNALFNAIGTQRSSRNNLIKRPYEFFYELFAQYLGTGQIKLNPLPNTISYGKKAWGKSINSLNIKKDYRDDPSREWEMNSLENALEYLFGDVLNASVGKIFVI